MPIRSPRGEWVIWASTEAGIHVVSGPERRRCVFMSWIPGVNEIDLFIAGRMLWRTNYVLLEERPHAAGFIALLANVFEAFCETGEMGRAGF